MAMTDCRTNIHSWTRRLKATTTASLKMLRVGRRLNRNFHHFSDRPLTFIDHFGIDNNCNCWWLLAFLFSSLLEMGSSLPPKAGPIGFLPSKDDMNEVLSFCLTDNRGELKVTAQCSRPPNCLLCQLYRHSGSVETECIFVTFNFISCN